VDESSSVATLSQLLDDDLEYDATTNRGLTNHLPMALVAKVGLGAPPEELERFTALYRRREIDAANATQHLTHSTWTRAVGTPNAYPDLVMYFDTEIEANGLSETLHRHMNYLVEGVAGAAFHGVIRLAYALDVASPKRVSTGLAYLAANALFLAPLGGAPPTSDDPVRLLQQLSTTRDWGSSPTAKNITEEMTWAANQAEFRNVASSLIVNADTPERLSEAALKLYASTNDFTALHGVTGLEALSRLRRYVDDVERFDRSTFQALAAAHLSIGAPAIWSIDQLDDLENSTKLDQATVEKRASLSNDEHVSKIVFSSKRLRDELGDPLYFAVAERAVLNDATSTEASLQARIDS
jgi:hypothetical protein